MPDYAQLNAPRIEPLHASAERPFWSVMIPVYQRATWLQQAIRSAPCQIPPGEPVQIMVVDDALRNGPPSAMPSPPRVIRASHSIAIRSASGWLAIETIASNCRAGSASICCTMTISSERASTPLSATRCTSTLRASRARLPPATRAGR